MRRRANALATRCRSVEQAVRRIRQSASFEELSTTLEDAARAFAAGAMLFRVSGDSAQSEKVEVPLALAPALRGAIETRDPVVAAATAGEISESILEATGEPEDGRFFVFPVVVEGQVPALLCVWGGVQGSSIELLSRWGPRPGARSRRSRQFRRHRRPWRT